MSAIFSVSHKFRTGRGDDPFFDFLKVGCNILGRGENDEKVRQWLTTAAGLALGAPPLTGPAAGALVRAAGGTAAEVGIDEHFINEVQALMKPGTSALFVLDQEGDMPAILQGIRGLGGTVLRANVDLKRVALIQSALAAADAQMEDRS